MMRAQRILFVCSVADHFYFANCWSNLELPNLFGNQGSKSLSSSKNARAKKDAILEAVSFTNNGKTATPEQQADVLRKVRALETSNPPPDDILSNPQTATALDGTWYLQYTSPSVVGDEDQFPDSWKPDNASEGDSNIPTQQFNAQGSVSAAGITVDTSNKVVRQIFNVAESKVENKVDLGWAKVVVGGTFRKSDTIDNRALVAFDSAKLLLKNSDIVLDFGLVFSALAIIRRTKDNGWLETTFIDDEMRLGRGNKGTMFVLTRSADAVKP